MPQCRDFYNVFMSRKKRSRGGILSWAGIILLLIAGAADFAILFTENYARNMLLTLPIWILTLVCFMFVGKQDEGKK